MTKSALYNQHFAKLVESIETLSVEGEQIFLSDHVREGAAEAFNVMSIRQNPADNASIAIEIIDENQFKLKMDGGLAVPMSGGLEKAGKLVKAWFKTVAPGRVAELDALLEPPAPAPIVEQTPAPTPVAVASAPVQPEPKKKKKWFGLF